MALTLGSIGAQDVASALLAALQGDPSVEVRWRAALALSRLGNPSVVEALKETLGEEANEKVREFIEEAIAKLQENRR